MLCFSDNARAHSAKITQEKNCVKYNAKLE